MISRLGQELAHRSVKRVPVNRLLVAVKHGLDHDISDREERYTEQIAANRGGFGGGGPVWCDARLFGSETQSCAIGHPWVHRDP